MDQSSRLDDPGSYEYSYDVTYTEVDVLEPGLVGVGVGRSQRGSGSPVRSVGALEEGRPFASTPRSGEQQAAAATAAAAADAGASAGAGAVVLDPDATAAEQDVAWRALARVPKGAALRDARVWMAIGAVSLFVLWILVVSLFREFHWAMVGTLVGSLHASAVLGVLIARPASRPLLRAALASFPVLIAARIAIALLLCFTVNIRIDDYCEQEGTLLCGPSAPSGNAVPSRAELRAVFVLANFVVTGTELVLLIMAAKRVLNHVLSAEAAVRVVAAAPAEGAGPGLPTSVPFPPLWRALSRASTAAGGLLAAGAPAAQQRSLRSDACAACVWASLCCLFCVSIIGAVILVSIFADVLGIVVFAAVDSI